MSSIFSAINPLRGLRPAKKPLPLLQAVPNASLWLKEQIAEANKLRAEIEQVKARINSIRETSTNDERLDTWYAEGEAKYQRWKKVVEDLQQYLISR